MTTRISFTLTHDDLREAVSRAQVVIVSENSWHILKPGAFFHSRNGIPLPEGFTCPVLDVSAIPEKCYDEMAEVIRANTSDVVGVLDVEALTQGLKALGAKVNK